MTNLFEWLLLVTALMEESHLNALMLYVSIRLNPVLEL